ncbi:hypothetical protein ACJZ2D_005168 [Fusarium nematophilum]
MAEEAPKPEPTADIPQVAVPFDSGANGLPSHAVQADALQKDIVMSDVPTEQPAASLCSLPFEYSLVPALQVED